MRQVKLDLPLMIFDLLSAEIRPKELGFGSACETLMF